MIENDKYIFDALFEKEICFWVYVSIERFAGEVIDINAKQFYVLVLKQDLFEYEKNKYKLDDFTFNKVKKYKNVYDRCLSGNEILDFRKNMDKFTKVVHNQYGRVCELKDNSFKKLYENLKYSSV